MPNCTRCGATIPEGTTACPSCAGPSPAAPAKPPAGPADGVLAWSRKVPLITNPVLVRDTFVAFMGAMLFVATAIVLLTGEPSFYWFFLVLSLAFYAFLLLTMLVLQVATGGGLETLFVIGPAGAGHHAGPTTRALDRFTATGSAAMRSAAGTGAALTAMAQEDVDIAWEDVRYVRVSTRLRFIELRSQYLIYPVVLYATEGNFAAVLAMVNRYNPKTASVKVR